MQQYILNLKVGRIHSESRLYFVYCILLGTLNDKFEIHSK